MSTVSPTEFCRRLVEKFAPVGTKLSLNEPDPADLTVVDGRATVVCQLYMLDGWRDRFEQHPEFDIAFFSRRFLAAESAALNVEHGLVRYPVRVQVGGKAAVLDRTEVTSSTREVPWDVDPEVTRFIGTYQLRTRS